LAVIYADDYKLQFHLQGLAPVAGTDF